MKKLLLLAAFGVAGLASAKDYKVDVEKKVSTEDISTKVFRLCGVVVAYYNSDGVKTFTTDQSELTGCMAWQNTQIAAIEQAGYTITYN